MKTIKDEFCSFEIAKELKDLGFNEMVIATYDEDQEFDLQNFEQNYETFPNHIIGVPLYQQIIEWFREKHDIHIAVTSYTNQARIGDKILFEVLIGNKENNFDAFIDNSVKRLKIARENRTFSDYMLYDLYNEARKFAILKAIELIKSM
jgi:hypothetical protein